MDPSQGTVHPRRRLGRNVAPRLALILVLLALVLGGMVLLFVMARHLETGQPGQPAPSATENPEPPVGTPAATPESVPAGSEPAESAPAGEAAPASAANPESPVTEPPAGGEAAQAPKYPPPLPWPSNADLPILKRYDIDWKHGETLLQDVRDHAPPPDTSTPWKDVYEFDEAALYWLIRTVAKLPRAAFKPGPPADDVDYDELLSMPQSFRGVPVTVSGQVGGSAKWEVPRPALAGFDHFYKVELYKRTAGNLANVCTVFVFDNPGPLLPGTTVRAKGYFYRIRDYETNHYNPDLGENVAYRYSCPIVVARYLEEVEPAKVATRDARADVLLVTTVAAFIALAAMAFFFLRRHIARRDTYGVVRPLEELTPDELRERLRFLEEAERSAGVPPTRGPDA